MENLQKNWEMMYFGVAVLTKCTKLPTYESNTCLQLNFLKLLLPTIIADVDKKFDDFSLN